jgi:UDP-2,3-diacylglucosamine pyrophosphatase LpxH
MSDPDIVFVVISDLHLGKNDDFDIFKAAGKEEAFEAFLDHCANLVPAVELVINGDFVDFLQLRPWDVYVQTSPKAIRQQALIKAKEIAAGNARVFQALGKFLSRAKNRITILLGNHDVELAYDEVWAEIRDAIVGSSTVADRLRILNRQTQYNPAVGGVKVHIEHGNTGDPWNEIHYRELFEDAETNSGFEFPAGTNFVYQVMNNFKESFRFVDLLKPEVPAVPLLLARLQPTKAATLLPDAARNFLGAIKAGFTGRVQKAVGGGSFGTTASGLATKDYLYEEMATDYVEEAKAIKATYGATGRFEQLDATHLEDFLGQKEFQAPGSPLGASFGPRWDKVKASFMNAILKRLGRPTRLEDEAFYQIDHSGRDVDAAKERLKGDIRIVLFGHTHGALKTEFVNQGVYINSGTWANLIELPTDSAQFPSWLQRIADNTFKRTSFPTYITLTPGHRGLSVSLNHWSIWGEQVLWTQGITP